MSVIKKSKLSTSPVSETSVTPAPTVRIIKVGTCKSLSCKSNLSYHIGHVIAEDVVGNYNIMFRVNSNSAAGFFSREWVSMAQIQQAFDKVPSGHAITSFTLFSIFQGKSQNSPGFLLGVLQNEGFVRQDKKRSYERTDTDEFMAEMVKLIDAGVDLQVQSKAVPQKSASKKLKAAVVPVDAVPAKPNDACQDSTES